MKSSIDLLHSVLESGRCVLYEHEVYALLSQAGVSVPAHEFIARGRLEELGDGDLPLAGPVFLKLVSETILHKSDVGGVRRLPSARGSVVRDAAHKMLADLTTTHRQTVVGFLVAEAVASGGGFGDALFVGFRGTSAFGPVLTVGMGGTETEAVATAMKMDMANVVSSVELTDEAILSDRLEQAFFHRWMTGQTRGRAAVCSAEALGGFIHQMVTAFGQIEAAAQTQGYRVSELECNPAVWAKGSWTPLDGLMRLAPASVPRTPIPASRVRRALFPKRVGIIGVSTRVNLGRIILRSALAGGFPAENLVAIHDGLESLDGVRCVPNLAALTEPLDLLIITVPAPGVPAVVEETVRTEAAAAGLIVSAGMGETESGQDIETEIQTILSKRPGSERPVFVGGNTVGLWSYRAKLDSFFVPPEKLPRPSGAPSGVAVISQSGAFLLTVMGRLRHITPDLLVSLGNQIDVRVSDVVGALIEDRDVQTVALYVEGLKPGDGVALYRQTKALRAQGRDVIIYKGGRSPLGRKAAEGHTASLAGNYRVFRTLMKDAGALFAKSVDDFLGLLRLSVGLRGKTIGGARLALMSNAGYETVGMADWYALGGPKVSSASLGGPTLARLRAIIESAKLSRLVNVRNPLDLTPIASDVVHADCAEALLEDEGVDAGLFGSVPLTVAMKSLPHGHGDDRFDAPDSYGSRFIELLQRCDKPFAVVVDAGSLYNPMANYMARGGVPVFRAADIAIRLLGKYLVARTNVKPATSG